MANRFRRPSINEAMGTETLMREEAKDTARARHEEEEEEGAVLLERACDDDDDDDDRGRKRGAKA